MKGLLKDGADGTEINELVSEMGKRLGQDVSGQILMDLLQTPDDDDGEIDQHRYWFGPIGIQYFKWAANDWAEYCEENYIKGTFKFGEMDSWKAWAKGKGISDKDLEGMCTKAYEQILVFEWESDAIDNKLAQDFLNEMYTRIKERLEEEANNR